MSDESHVTGPSDHDAGDDYDVAMAEARARLLDVPADIVVVNHAMGLWELAAIHLSADDPDLAAAALAIDAMAAIVEGLGDRLGDDSDTMRDALSNIRLAYVSARSRSTP